MILRPRQVKAVEDIRSAFQEGFCAPTLCASTGFGKSATAAVMIKNALKKGKRVFFLAHLMEILTSTAEKLDALGIPYGWIAAKELGNRRQQVQLCMVQTLVRRIDQGLYTPPDFMIVDESHLAVSKSYQTIFEWAKAGPKFYVSGGSLLLGLSGTPGRLDQRGLEEISDVLIPTCSTETLIGEGLLAPVRYLKPSTPDMRGVGTIGSDYNPTQLSEVMRKPAVTGSALATYLEHGRGRPGLGFAVDIKRSHELAELFKSAGLRSVAVSGEDDDEIRDWAVRSLKKGEIDFLWSVKLFTTGIDLPCVSYISDMAPTKSLTRYLQGIGRGMRTAPGKADLIYADHAGNIDTHGNPLMARSWSLKGTARPGETQERAMSVRTCPKCFGHTPSVRPTCKHCGHTFELKGREIEEREGELEEIQLAAATETARLAARSEQGQQKDRDSLIALARRKGYKNAEKWADYVLAGRTRKEAREALTKAVVADADRQYVIAELEKLRGSRV